MFGRVKNTLEKAVDWPNFPVDRPEKRHGIVMPRSYYAVLDTVAPEQMLFPIFRFRNEENKLFDGCVLLALTFYL